MSKALYAGSFDPPTNGHMDVVKRASGMFAEVVVGVTENTEKTPMLSPAERVELLKTLTSGIRNVSVEKFSALTVDFAGARGCSILLRGIRSVTDFEYELAMAIANRKLGGIETLFLPSSPEFAFLSSRLIKEAAKFGGDIADFVPACVVRAFKDRGLFGNPAAE